MKRAHVVAPQQYDADQDGGGDGNGDSDGHGDGQAYTHKHTKRMDVLEIKEARARSRRLVVRVRASVVEGRFWLEKCVVVSDAIQIYALLWQLSQPWPWPSPWLRHTRWMNAWNLDAFSFRDQGAAMGATSQSFSLWGELAGYWVYALAFAVVPWVCAFVLVVLDTWWTRSGRVDVILRKCVGENVLLQAGQFLYIPVGLAVLRLINCDADGHVSVDPGTMGKCWSVGHTCAVAGITIGLGGGFLLGFPWLLYRRVAPFLVYDEGEAHEQFVKSKELEYVLGTSDSYVELYIPLYASYQRHSVLLPVEMCASKLTLLVIFSVLRSPPPSKSNEGLQGTLFFLVTLYIAYQRTWRPSYRVQCTNLLSQLIHWVLVANTFIASLSANAVRSALTVSTSITLLLFRLNIGAAIIIMLLLLRSLQMWRTRSTVVILNGRLRTQSTCWPTHPLMAEIVDHGPTLVEFVKAIQHCKYAIFKALITTQTMQPHQELSLVLDKVNDCLQSAIGINHPLADQLYELAIYSNEVYVGAMAMSPVRSHAPSDTEFHRLAGMLQRHDRKHMMVASKNKRVLSKLLITRAWQSSAIHPITVTQSETSPQSFREYLVERSRIHALSDNHEWEDMEMTIEIQGESDSVELQVVSWCSLSNLLRARTAHTVTANNTTRPPDSTVVVSLADLSGMEVDIRLVQCADGGKPAEVLQAYKMMREHAGFKGQWPATHYPTANEALRYNLDELVKMTETNVGFDRVIQSL